MKLKNKQSIVINSNNDISCNLLVNVTNSFIFFIHRYKITYSLEIKNKLKDLEILTLHDYCMNIQILYYLHDTIFQKRVNNKTHITCHNQ